MKFYDRAQELLTLNTIYKQCAEQYGKITVLTGRRRVGKTLLAQKHAEDKPSLYLFTSKKSEKLLCQEFLQQYEAFTGSKHIGEISRFAELFELCLQRGTEKPFVLIIDEFQEFKQINPSVFSELQHLWDTYKGKTHLHVIFIGSIYSLMKEIFQNEKEPLYGRADRVMYVRPFQAITLKEILQDHNAYSAENLFYTYLFTGGVPRYVELFHQHGTFTKEAMIQQIYTQDSFFIEEGKSLLIQEFGKDYTVYFSILELIASGKSSRNEIESVLLKSIGGHLERLEYEYDMIKKRRPLGAKASGRLQKYAIQDNFIAFWFRFVYKYMSLIQSNRFDYVQQIVTRDLSTFAGPVLEKLFTEIIGYSTEYGEIGTYWERGNQNEIDIVAKNDLDKKLYFAEVKLNKEKIKLAKLQEKAKKLLTRYEGYATMFQGLCLEDIDTALEQWGS